MKTKMNGISNAAQAMAIAVLSVVLIGRVHAQTVSDSAIRTILDGTPGTVTVAGITVYGTLDVNAVYQDHGVKRTPYAANALGYPILANSNRSQFQYGANGLGQSFIGLKGQQSLRDLTGADFAKGWSLAFDLQSGFDPVTGQVANGIKSVSASNGVPLRQQQNVSDSSRAGQFFNGEAWVGLGHTELGELRFGRQTTVLADAVGQFDAQKGAPAFSPLGYFGNFSGGLGDTEDRAWNNSLKYKNAFGPVRVSAQYRFEGGGEGGDDYVFGAGIDFDKALKGLHVDGIWGHLNTGIAAQALSTANCTALVPAGGCNALNVVNSTISKNDALGLMARYEINALTLFGGWQQIISSDGAARAGGNIQGGFALDPLTGSSNNNYFRFLTDRVQNVTWTGLRYAFSPKLTGALAYYHIEQNNFLAGTTTATGTLTPGSAATCQQATLINQTTNAVRPISDTRSTFGVTKTASNCAGREDLLSALIDYQLTPRLDIYGGIMWSEVSGGLASGFLHRAAIDPQIGVRFRF